MSGEPFAFLAKKLAALQLSDSLRALNPYTHDGMALIDSAGRSLVNFGSNDYLGLAFARVEQLSLLFLHPNQTKTPDTCLTGAGASALVSGFTTLHANLCRSLAELEETVAAVLFPSGYAACSGTVGTLAEAGDMLLSDQLNHASLIDGCRLSRATRFVYPHLEVESVRQLLIAQRHNFARAWIVTDGVFGMDGDVAPLPALCDLAEQFDAHVIVDEAHATGVLGNDGSGVCSELGVKSRVAIRIGTLSKAIGSQGGFVVGPQVVIDYLINRCRPLIFSTAGSPLTIAAAIQGIESIRAEPQRRERVRMLAQRLRDQMTARFPSQIPPTSVSGVPIVPIIVGANEAAIRIAAQLRNAGFFVPAIRPPTVPIGKARLRISLSACHQEVEVERLAEAISSSIT